LGRHISPDIALALRIPEGAEVVGDGDAEGDDERARNAAPRADVPEEGKVHNRHGRA
jgi:hypothetical protein